MANNQTKEVAPWDDPSVTSAPQTEVAPWADPTVTGTAPQAAAPQAGVPPQPVAPVPLPPGLGGPPPTEFRSFAQHPSSVLYRNIRETQTPQQIAGRQQAAQQVSRGAETAGAIGGLIAAPEATIMSMAGSEAAGGVAKAAHLSPFWQSAARFAGGIVGPFMPGPESLATSVTEAGRPPAPPQEPLGTDLKMPGALTAREKAAIGDVTKAPTQAPTYGPQGPQAARYQEPVKPGKAPTRAETAAAARAARTALAGTPTTPGGSPPTEPPPPGTAPTGPREVSIPPAGQLRMPGITTAPGAVPPGEPPPAGSASLGPQQVDIQPPERPMVPGIATAPGATGLAEPPPVGSASPGPQQVTILPAEPAPAPRAGALGGIPTTGAAGAGVPEDYTKLPPPGPEPKGIPMIRKVPREGEAGAGGAAAGRAAQAGPGAQPRPIPSAAATPATAGGWGYVVRTPEEWAAWEQQQNVARGEASAAGLFSAARGKAGVRPDYQERVGLTTEGQAIPPRIETVAPPQGEAAPPRIEQPAVPRETPPPEAKPPKAPQGGTPRGKVDLSRHAPDVLEEARGQFAEAVRMAKEMGPGGRFASEIPAEEAGTRSSGGRGVYWWGQKAGGPTVNRAFPWYPKDMTPGQIENAFKAGEGSKPFDSMLDKIATNIGKERAAAIEPIKGEIAELRSLADQLETRRPQMAQTLRDIADGKYVAEGDAKEYVLREIDAAKTELGDTSFDPEKFGEEYDAGAEKSGGEVPPAAGEETRQAGGPEQAAKLTVPGQQQLEGMGGHIKAQQEGAAQVQGERLTQEFQTPLGTLERPGTNIEQSPLFRGTEAAAQKEIFPPKGKTPPKK